MELFVEGINNILRWDVMLALLVGSIGGVIIGAIRGVGAAVAIAILLPATFSMDPLVGLTMLLGIYGASMYGGAIPAILINIQHDELERMGVSKEDGQNALNRYTREVASKDKAAHRRVDEFTHT